MAPSVQANSHVTVEYSLRDDDGELLDSSDGEDGAPIEYVHGYGQLVPGLETALAGLHAGDEREVVVPASAGYGERDEELMMEVDRSELPDPKKVEVGDELVAESEDGDEIAMQVVELKKDVVVVDANHPLAGMTLHYKVKIVAVRDATDEEIEQAAAEHEEAHEEDEHEHGPDCDHDHAPHAPHAKGDAAAPEPASELVTLGRKQPRVLN
jgi:FKBP-type peptidyl-prolyl cis-trans isomerase SlyD